jgi:hypothetical protein
MLIDSINGSTILYVHLSVVYLTIFISSDYIALNERIRVQ